MSCKQDLMGQRFGRLTVIGVSESVAGRTAWQCRCDCGNITVVKSIYLTTGDTSSCGCLFLETSVAKGRAKKIDLTGQRFGRLLVTGRSSKPGSKGEICWECLCDCGTECPVSGGRLRRGLTQSCGCLKLELMRKRAPLIGCIVRRKKCRTCGILYPAIGPQKECSDKCRLRWHAEDEARRRGEAFRLHGASLGAELERRMDRE
jgi:hypothetical protein